MPKTLNVRLKPEEIDGLARYAREQQRSKTSVVRELLRGLKPSTEKRRRSEALAELARIDADLI